MELFGTAYLASQYFWTTVAFLVLLAVLTRFVLPAVNAVLDARAAAIKNDLACAAAQRAEAEALLADYTSKLAAARVEAAKVVSTARAEAEALAAQRLAEVEAELGRKTEESRKLIAAQQAEAVREVKADLAKLVVEAAEKVLEATVDAKMAVAVADKALVKGLN